MLQILQLSQRVVGSKLTRRVIVHQVIAADAGAVYVGLGDQFDDDRRLVRDVAQGRAS
jgi:hypothetical protein